MTDLDQERATRRLRAPLRDPRFHEAVRTDPALRAQLRKLQATLRELAVVYARELAEGDEGDFLRRVLGEQPEARA